MKNKLEVIAWSLEDAIKIEKAGADRIELVFDLSRGGLTPSFELTQEIVNTVKVPVRVMIRDVDNSFIYNKEIHKSHIEFIKNLKQTKAEGIVYGSLNSEGKINFKQLEDVISVKGNLKLTFHRAFDNIDNKEIAIKEFRNLAKYDVDSLLTSGLKESAIEGVNFIKELIDEKKSINILPGSKIDFTNYKEILEKTGANYLHIGTCVRDENNQIIIDKIKEIKKGMN